MTRYRCATCKVEAEIDKEKKLIVIHLPPLKLPAVRSFPVSACFPSHFDCELAKPMDKINLDKLIRVEVKKK